MRSSISLASALLLALHAHDVSVAASPIGNSTASRRGVGGSGMTMKTSGNSRYWQTGSIYGSSTSSSAGSATLNDQDTFYAVDIELGGHTFAVQVDTGSSDLWVYPHGASIKLANTTQIRATEAYGSGVANGTIQFAELKLDSFTVPSQAFILAETAVDFGFIDDGSASGILGLAFETHGLSPVNDAIKSAFKDDTTTVGATPIFNILVSNPSLPNSFDILLDRTGDLDDTDVGTLIIGDHAPGFQNVVNQPRLPRVVSGRWSVPSDGMQVNGKQFNFKKSSVSGLKSGQFATVLDSGFTFPPMPPAAVDFIYSSIPGAVFTDASFPQWIVPCNATTTLSFTFGGVQIPIHPLDITYVNEMTAPGTNTTITFCHNTYQYLDLDPAGFNGFDAILGDSFLRNVYASFNYGPSEATADGAYIQLIPTTNAKTAPADFLASRRKVLASLPPELPPAQFAKLFGGSDDDGSIGSAIDAPSTGADSSSDQLYDLVKKYGPIVVGLLAANVIVGALLFIVGLIACLKGVIGSGARTRSVKSTYAPVRFKDAVAEEENSMYKD